MKQPSLSLLLLRLFLLCMMCQGAFAGAESNVIIIRFRTGTPELATWKANHRTGEIPSLLSILGTHQTQGYVSDAVLKAAENRMSLLRSLKKSSLNPQTTPRLFPATEGLADICVVHYSAAIPASVLASKLARNAAVLYAEPMPIYEIVSTPNDPLASEQYHLWLTRTTDAWDSVQAGSKPVVVGIVDTGSDTTHEDLQGQFWHNPGESGVDGNGVDKRVNKVDDDNNGFVDDWYGWDFVGADGKTEDNSPLPGNDHGTHVAGLVGAVINNHTGVAGMSPYVQLLPVKVGRDNPNARSVERSGDGIVYAASMGANIINCSFGSSSPSFADLAVVTSATELGALVVAAAGNSSSNSAFYPAAHPPVLSVAATDKLDQRASFSNFHNSVDVSAPGVTISSTMPGNRYQTQDGTSMASPIVAGAAALVKYANPSLTPAEVHAVLKANADSIDSLNVSFVGLIGTGRINTLASVQRKNPYCAEIVDVLLTDENNDGVFESGETVEVSCKVHNLLAPLQNVRITIAAAPSTFQPLLNVSASDVGAISTNGIASPSNVFSITIPNDAPLNGSLSLLIQIMENNVLVGRLAVNQTVNPTYRTLHENAIAITLSNSGNLGYNDYPINSQGQGISWRNGPSLSFEGGLLIGTEPTYLPNVVRGADASYRDNGFRGSTIVDIRRDSLPNGARAVTTFSDSSDRYPVGVIVREQAIESTADTLENSVIITYDITNTTAQTIDAAYASLFFDWDLGNSGENDGVAWDNNRGFAVIQNAIDRSIPTIGVSMISGFPLNFAAIDNQGGGNIPSIYDGFIRAEKWLTMSRGMLRTNSSITDVSMMIGGGPIRLAPGQTRQIAFTISIGPTLEDVTRSMNSVRGYAQELGLHAVPYVPRASTDNFEYITNGPTFRRGDAVTVHFSLANITPVEFSLVDVMGRTIATPIMEHELTGGTYDRQLTIPDLAPGVYFVVMLTYSGTDTIPIQVLQ